MRTLQYALTFLSFTCHCKAGWGYHPAAWHSNRTDCPLNANLSSPKTFTLPFSAITLKKTFLIYVPACMYVLLYNPVYACGCVSLWQPTKPGRNRWISSTVSFGIPVVSSHICTHRWASPPHWACSFSKDGFHWSRVIDLVSQSLNCLTNASPLFPFISSPASQISHLRPWEIQYLTFEVCCLAEWKAVDATDNWYRQKDNYRRFGALSKRMVCLCWFRLESSDVLYALLAVPFLWWLLFDAWFGVIYIVPSNSKSDRFC